MSEGLQWSFVKYQNNQSCLDLLEGSPISVFSLLNEVCWPLRNKQKEISCRLKKKKAEKNKIPTFYQAGFNFTPFLLLSTFILKCPSSKCAR